MPASQRYALIFYFLKNMYNIFGFLARKVFNSDNFFRYISNRNVQYIFKKKPQLGMNNFQSLGYYDELDMPLHKMEDFLKLCLQI